MTAQKSTAKNNYFMVNFRNRLKSNMKTSIIITILHILAVPMVLLQAIISWISEENYDKAYLLALKAVGGNDRLVNYDALPKVYDFNEAYIFIGFLALGIAILSGILIALSNFSYLYKKTQVDMIYLFTPLDNNTALYERLFCRGNKLYRALHRIRIFNTHPLLCRKSDNSRLGKHIP